MRRLTAALAVLIAILGACSTKSDTDRAVDGLVEGLLNDDVYLEYTDAPEESATCMAERALTTYGSARLIEIVAANATRDDADDGEGVVFDYTVLTDDEIRAFIGAMDTCGTDVDGLVTDAVAGEIASTPSDDLPVSADQAECIAADVTADLGAARLFVLAARSEGAGAQFADYSTAEFEAVAAAFLSCVDVRGALLDQFRANDVDEPTVQCLDTNISDADLAAILETGLRRAESPTTNEILQPAFEICIGPEVADLDQSAQNRPEGSATPD